MIVPDDELCIQTMLGIDAIPEDIEHEYMIRVRMLHRQLAGGPIGPVAIVDMLRSLDYGPPTLVQDKDRKSIEWRSMEVGTQLHVFKGGKWRKDLHATFQGEVGGGTIAVKIDGRIDEYNACDLRLTDNGLPADVDVESFTAPAMQVAPQADARLSLLDDKNEVEMKLESEKIHPDDEPPIPPPVKQVNWGTVKKGTEVWFRDGENVYDASFQRCVGNGMAVITIAGEEESRDVSRTKLLMP
jgi:hypothetical protein